MSKDEWIKRWSGQAPSLPEPDRARALLVLAGKKEGPK